MWRRCGRVVRWSRVSSRSFWCRPVSSRVHRRIPVNRFMLRGARIPSVTSGTRTVAVPDGKPNEPGWIVQDLSPVLRTGWEALSFRPSGLTPPDVQVAVGPAHVVEAVNVALGVYSKEGVQLVTSGLSTVFATGSDFLSDPRIQYDGLSGRWFVA